MTAQKKSHLTAEEYIQRERIAEVKREYLDGEVYAMAGASRAHNQIASNLVVSLGSQLAERPCSVYVSDMKVRTRTSETNKYSYPDVIVTCGDEEYEDDHNDILLNPKLIVEVLSDSTEAYDRGLKFFHYQLIPSLQDYLLVTQNYCRLEHYRRRDDKQWVYSEFHHLDDEVVLDTLGCVLQVTQVYQKVGLE